MLKFLYNVIGGVMTWLGTILFGFFGIILAIIYFIWKYRLPITLLIIAVTFLVFVPVIGIPVAIFCCLFAVWLILSITRIAIYQKKKRKIIVKMLKDKPELLNDKETCIKILYSEVGDMIPEDMRDKDEEKNKDISIKAISDMIDEYIKKNK